MELQFSSGSGFLDDCGMQHRKIPNDCKAISLWKWDFSISGSDGWIPPQTLVSVQNMHEWLDLRDIHQLKHFWVRKGKERGWEISLQNHQHSPRIHSHQIVHAEKNNDWEMSVFGLWEHQGETFPNLHLKLLELFIFSFSFVFPASYERTVIQIFLLTPNDLEEKRFFSFQFVNTLLTTCQNIQWTKNTLQILFY